MSNIPDKKKFQVMILKRFTGLEKIKEELNESLNEEIENIKKNQSELKNTVTELKTSRGDQQ